MIKDDIFYNSMTPLEIFSARNIFILLLFLNIVVTFQFMFIGNGLIMNWYYLKITKLDIILFWKDIEKITFGVIIVTIIGKE